MKYEFYIVTGSKVNILASCEVDTVYFMNTEVNSMHYDVDGVNIALNKNPDMIHISTDGKQRHAWVTSNLSVKSPALSFKHNSATILYQKGGEENTPDGITNPKKGGKSSSTDVNKETSKRNIT